MRPYGQSHDPEAHEGLIRTLVHAVRGSDQANPYLVTTTAPSLWIPYCSSDKVTVLDVSGFFGPTRWRSGSDVRDRLLAKLRSLGWPDGALLPEYALKNIGKGASWTSRVDLVLADAAGSPVAAFDIKHDFRPLARHLYHAAAEAQMLAISLGVSHMFVVRGEQVFKCVDGVSKLVESPLPTPRDFGIDWSSGIGDAIPTSQSPASIIACDTVDDLLQALDRQPEAAAIIDYTIPWGNFDTGVADTIRAALPEPLQSVRFRDPVAALIGLVSVPCGAAKRVAAIVPPSVAQAASYADLRTYIVDRVGLAGVIQLPALPSLFDTFLAPLIVIMGDYPSRALRTISLVKLANRGDIVAPDTAIWWNALSDGLLGKRAPAEFTAPSPVGQPWTRIAEHQEAQAAAEQLKRLGETVPLSDLCDVFQGYGHQTSTEVAVGGGIPLIRGRDISAGAVIKDDLQWCKPEGAVPEQFKVKQDDILIQRIGASPHCMVVMAELVGAVASQTVYVARPKDPRANANAICQFLRSGAAQRLLAAGLQGAGAPTLSLSTLRGIRIPILPPDTFRDFRELEQVESELRSQADKLAALRLGLYSAESPRDLRRRLQEYRLISTAMSSSLKQAGTLPFQVHNFYPYPVAYSYRLIGSRIGTESLYRVQMRVMENILAFVGSVTLALLEPDGRAAVRDPDKRHCNKPILQSYWEGGVSPGHWRDICSRGATVLASYNGNELAVALGNLWAKGSSFPDHIKQLIEAKNDFKHDRGPDDEESMRQASACVRAHIDEVIRELAFFTRFPVRLVRELDKPRGTQTVILRTLDYIGDHPVHPSGHYEYTEALPTYDLYIQVRPDFWVPLYPFLTAGSCPRCKAQETYFIDKWLVLKQEAKLKSFERGHQESAEEVAKTLSQW